MYVSIKILKNIVDPKYGAYFKTEQSYYDFISWLRSYTGDVDTSKVPEGCEDPVSVKDFLTTCSGLSHNMKLQNLGNFMNIALIAAFYE